MCLKSSSSKTTQWCSVHLPFAPYDQYAALGETVPTSLGPVLVLTLFSHREELRGAVKNVHSKVHIPDSHTLAVRPRPRRQGSHMLSIHRTRDRGLNSMQTPPKVTAGGAEMGTLVGLTLSSCLLSVKVLTELIASARIRKVTSRKVSMYGAHDTRPLNINY